MKKMADYEELIKMLRLEVECDRKIYPQGLPSKDILISAAADAIEELQSKAEGEWIEENGGWDDIYYSCSVCNAAVCTIDGTVVDNGWNYCPECGAKMNGIRRLPEDDMEGEDG